MLADTASFDGRGVGAEDWFGLGRDGVFELAVGIVNEIRDKAVEGFGCHGGLDERVCQFGSRS